MPFAVDLAAVEPYHEGRDDLQKHADFRALFYENSRSLRVLQEILAKTLLFERAYAPGDPYETARREGMREVGIWLMETIDQPGMTYQVKRQSEIEDENQT